MTSEHITERRLYEMWRLRFPFTENEYKHLKDCAECIDLLRVFLRESQRTPPPQDETEE